MYIQRFQNPAGSKIVVTSTSTNIYDLINTAQSTSLVNAGFPSMCNAIIIQPENGDIRVLMDGSDPTANNGFQIPQGSIASLFNIPLKNLKLIRKGSSNVTCSIQVGEVPPTHATTFSLSSTGGGAGTDVNIAEVGGVAIGSAIPTTSASLVPLIDDASATITYVGLAEPGTSHSSASWQVKRLDSSTISLVTTYADGDSNFDNIWDDRASLSYS